MLPTYGNGLLINDGEAHGSKVRSSDGLTISMRSWGDRSKPAIVFIHGFNQADLCWEKQVRSDLVDDFHLVTYDLRGHGATEKPFDEQRYRDARLWSDDLTAVMDNAGVNKAVFVAWSLGSRVAFDYLSHKGASRVAAINVVGNGVTTRPELKNVGAADLHSLIRSDDLSTNIRGTEEFLRRCFEIQPPADVFAKMLAYNMVVPAEVRRMMAGMPGQSEEFYRALTLPILFTFGQDDVLNNIAAAKFGASIISGSRLSLYPGVGHSPFYEQPERFNEELRAFATEAFLTH